MGLKESILGYLAQDAVVPFRAFGQDLYLRVLTGEERDRYETSKQVVEFNTTGRKMEGSARLNLHNLRARLAVLVLCDEHGRRVFTDADAALVGQLDARELDRVYEEGCRLNGLDSEALENAEKNSVTARNGCSG